MVKISLKYAAICGVFLTIIYHVSYYFGSNPLIDLSHLIFDLILFGLFIFFTEKEFKTYQTGGIFHFWQGMTMGFLVYSIASIIFILAFLVQVNINPDIILKYKEEGINQVLQNSEFYIDEIGSQEFNKKIDEAKNAPTWYIILLVLGKKLLAGFFITPVISIILRKQPK